MRSATVGKKRTNSNFKREIIFSHWIHILFFAFLDNHPQSLRAKIWKIFTYIYWKMGGDRKVGVYSFILRDYSIFIQCVKYSYVHRKVKSTSLILALFKNALCCRVKIKLVIRQAHTYKDCSDTRCEEVIIKSTLQLFVIISEYKRKFIRRHLRRPARAGWGEEGHSLHFVPFI